jgi:hemoglobin
MLNQEGQTLFQRIGGEKAMTDIVDKFYERVLADDRVKHFFDDVDMEILRQHQNKYLTYLFGGLPNYLGKSLKKTHQKMVQEKGLSDVHFDAFIENLGLTLIELGVSDLDLVEVYTIGESLRNEILCK